MLPELLKPKQAAALAGMSPWMLYRRIGKVAGPPTKRRGRYIYLPREEFLAWAAQDVIA